MPDFHINFHHVKFIVFILIISLGFTNGQTKKVSCYQCTNCSDPSAYTNSKTTGCNACFKLAVTVEYAPYTYVVRRCVLACLETTQNFGGASAVVTCCASDNCNRGSQSISSIERHSLFLGLTIFYSLIKLFIN